jgi:hypothetical protein
LVKGIFELEIALDFRYSKPKYVVYATGQEDGHIMDWAGCNFRRAPVPDAKFDSYDEAKEFISENDGKIKSLPVVGTHVADVDDLWDLRTVDKELSQDYYEFLKDEYRLLKESGSARKYTYG